MSLYLGPHSILLIYVSVWGSGLLPSPCSITGDTVTMKPPVLILLLSVVVGVVSLTEPRITGRRVSENVCGVS